MKKLIVFIFSLVLLGSCETIHYFYQVNEIKPSNTKTITSESSGYQYANSDVRITYSFWGPNGYIYVKIFNKSSENIYLNLNKSFFVLNGYVKDYYENKSYEKTQKSSTFLSKSVTGLTYDNYIGSNRATVSNSNENSVTTPEMKILTIPKNSYRILRRFNIEEYPFKRCGVTLYPKRKKKIVTSEYDIETTPVVFRNILSYSKGGKIGTIDNEFYISKISNHRKEDFIKSYKIDYCGSLPLEGKGMPDISPFKFYNKYSDVTPKNEFNWSLIEGKTIWGK